MSRHSVQKIEIKKSKDKGIFYWRTNLCTAFINLTYTTDLLEITNDFTDTSNKGKINNNICCSFEKFDILIKAFTDAIYFSFIIKGGHKTKLTYGNNFHLKF